MQLKLTTCGTRSNCPINAVVEVLGDQWSLLILRNMLLLLHTRFSEFRASDEGIATNILGSRLNQFVAKGLAEKFPDPLDGRASIYLPTDRAIDFIPMLLAAIAWSDVHQPDADKHSDLMALYRSDPHGASARVAERARQFRKETRP